MDIIVMIGQIKGFIIDNGLARAFIIFLILLATYITARVVKYFVRRSFRRSSRFLKVDSTQYALLRHFVTALIYTIGIGFAIFMIPSLKELSVSLFAGAGILAVIIGFASQQAVSNIISGVFIAIFKPFRVDDRIKIGTDMLGIVEDITLRHTVIRNFENKRLVIPNSVINNEVIENASIIDPKTIRYVDIGISYDSDIDKAMKIMQEEAIKHPDFIDNRSDEDKEAKVPPVTVRVMGFGDFSVNLRAWVWTNDPLAAFKLGTDLNKSIKKRFDKEGIEIPFPYRTIVYKDKIKKAKKRSKKRNNLLNH